MLMPAFHKRKKNAITIARIVAGYGEVEFLLAWTAGTALACQTSIPSGTSKAEHRHYFEKEGLRQIFSIWKNADRINEARNISRHALVKHGLIPKAFCPDSIGDSQFERDLIPW